MTGVFKKKGGGGGGIHIEEHVPYMLVQFALLQRKTPTLYIRIPIICRHQLMSLCKPRQKNVVLGLQIKDYLIPCEKPLANPWISEEAGDITEAFMQNLCN
jgi:hypothetical protein